MSAVDKSLLRIGVFIMKKIFAFTILALLLTASAVFASEALPKTVAGITLGTDVKQYSECCDLKLDTPIADAPFLNEMVIKNDAIPGIRGGSIIYGNCKNEGKVVRIKLKFHNRGKGLFNQLLEKYEDIYGKPDSYKGDAFKNVIAWEWNFIQGDERVDLMLMWSRDKEIRPGVSIKMTYTSLLEDEYACFKEKMNKLATGRGGPSKIKNLNDFVPR